MILWLGKSAEINASAGAAVEANAMHAQTVGAAKRAKAQSVKIVSVAEEINDFSMPREKARPKIPVFATKCISCAGGIGIALCTIFMTLGALGIIAVSISNNALSMPGMPYPQASSSSQYSILGQIATFFSSASGEVILIVSFALMILGFWLHKKQLSTPILAVIGSVILFVSMYIYFSIIWEIVGAIFLVSAYVISYSKIFKLPS